MDKKRFCPLALAAVLAAGMLAGCGSSADTASTAEATEEVSEYAQDVAGAADVVESAYEQAESDYEENGLVSQDTILEMVQTTAGMSTDPCAEETIAEKLALYCAYLDTVGKEKAPDHPVTQMAEAVFAYIETIVIDGHSYADEEAEAAMEAMDEVVDTYFSDVESQEEMTAEFYQMIQ